MASAVQQRDVPARPGADTFLRATPDTTGTVLGTSVLSSAACVHVLAVH